MKRTNNLNWALFFLAGILGLNLSSVLHLVYESFPPYLLPNIGQVADSFKTSPAVWLKAFIYTFSFSLLAGLLVILLGTLLGSFAAYFRLWSVDRWLQLIWSIPLIAIATYLLLVVGYGWLYGLILAIFLGLYPVQKHVFDSCSLMSEGICSIAASFGLSRWQEFRHLRVKSSLFSMGTALSQALPLCFIGETMGEFTVGEIHPWIGLGGLLRQAQSSGDYPKLWLCILLMMFLVYCSGEAVAILWNRGFQNPTKKEFFQ